MKTWHETHCALFGNKIPPEMAEAWTGVWAVKGFTNAVLTQAVYKLALLSTAKRPQWPQEHIEGIERLSSQILIDLALAGRLDGKELMLAAHLAKENHDIAQAEAKKKCVGFAEWDRERGLPEAKKYHAAKEVLEKIKNSGNRIAAKECRDTNTPNIGLGEIVAGIGGMNSRGGGE